MMRDAGRSDIQHYSTDLNRYQLLIKYELYATHWKPCSKFIRHVKKNRQKKPVWVIVKINKHYFISNEINRD
jgi:hypothetical protein